MPRRATVVNLPSTIEEQVPATIPGASLTALAFPPDLSIEQWVKCVGAVKIYEGGWSWWLGDSMEYAERRGSEFQLLAEQYVGTLGFAPQTVQNCLWVAKRFAVKRRREALSF